MSEKERKNFRNLYQKKYSLPVLVLYGIILVIYIITIPLHDRKVAGTTHKLEHVRTMGMFKNYFFTGWNFALQIVFLLLAVIDEATKLINIPFIQRRVEKARQFLFSTLVFPGSLLVMTIFWGIWHIDRELIFPKAIDEFYPSWLNHTLHSLILIPLIVEIYFQSGNKNFRVSRTTAMVVMLIYSTVYKILYLNVYFQHGIWLYPIYKNFDWAQRIAFILFQFFLLIGYQQVGISLLNRGRAKELKTKSK